MPFLISSYVASVTTATRIKTMETRSNVSWIFLGEFALCFPAALEKDTHAAIAVLPSTFALEQARECKDTRTSLQDQIKDARGIFETEFDRTRRSTPMALPSAWHQSAHR